MNSRLIALPFLSILFAVSSFAQTPVTDIVDWQPYESPVDEFAIVSPGVLKISGAFGEGDSRIYGLVAKGVYLFVVTDPLSSARYSKVVEKFVQDSGKAFPDIAKLEKPVKLSFVDPSGFTNEMLFTKTDGRSYFVHTLSEDGDNAIAKRFLKSFQIVKKAKAVVEVVSPKVDSAPTITTNQQPSATGVGSGAGSGSGMGNGVGPGRGDGNRITNGIGTGDFPGTPPASARVNANLRLLSKPKATYTDVARTYGISGFVNLRVTFLANGKIGTITPIKKLPFGVTDIAVKAAQRIQFEPAYSNGQPYEVTKVLQYSFTIY